MERNVNFPVKDLDDLSIRLAWAQLELYADDIDEIQVIASGDSHTLTDLRIAVKNGVLTVEQPQYGISLDITRGHWMQLCIRVPRTWDQTIHANTISGLITTRGVCGRRIVLETITGDIKATLINAGQISLRTTAGYIHGDQLTSERLTSRSVSGDITLDNASAMTCRFTSVSGDMSLKLKASFEDIEVRTVSGNCCILTDMETLHVSMRTVSGHKIIDGVQLAEDEDAPTVRATGVSGDLKMIGYRNSQSNL